MGGISPRHLVRVMRSLAIVFGAGFAMTACATTPQASSHMAAGGVAMPPAGLLDLCRRSPEVCGQVQGGVETPAIVLASVPAGEEEATGANPLPAGAYSNGAKAFNAAPAERLLIAGSGETPLPDTGDREAEANPAEDGAGSDSSTDTELPTAPASPESGLLRADAASFALLNRINQTINVQIRARDDVELYGMAEYWTLPLTLGPASEGDCEDYALEKRQALIAAGVPESALFLAIGHSVATGRHAVLVVSTDQGDYVLDNMTPHILPWHETPYQWQIRQMAGDLLSWRHAAAQTS